MVRTMDRSLSKFLYEFLPENTLNHANIQISGRVKSISSLYRDGSEVSLDAPDGYVINRVQQHFYRWPNSEDLLDEDLYANVEIVVPGKALYNTFPLTFECPNNDCQMFIRFRREHERDFTEHDSDDLFSCDNCGTRIGISDQLPFVAICECGEMTELWAPTHEHGDQELNMRLARPTTQISDWEWQCVHPECTETFPFMAYSVQCPDPACPNEDLYVTNHTDSEVFYPQTKDFINLQEDLQKIDDSSLYRAKVVSDYILEDELQRPSDSEIKKQAIELAGGVDEFIEADKDEEERLRQQAREMLTQDRQEHQQHVVALLEDNPDYTDQRKVALAEECHEFLSLTCSAGYEPSSDFPALSFEEMAASPSKTHLNPATINEYQNYRDNLNISSIHLIEEVPITTITYGYTRIDSEADETIGPSLVPEDQTQQADRAGDQSEEETVDADEDDTSSTSVSEANNVDVQLNLFRSRNNPYPKFYARENKAEGVLVKFDPEQVLDWLEQNAVIEDRDSIDNPRNWFVMYILAPSRYESLRDIDNQTHQEQNHPQAISRHVYSLLNSYAHAFMNTIGLMAGVQRESLVERVMPHTLSFLVYKRPDTDQAFGTIHSLFEERFEEFVDQFREQDRCPLNRVCYADENGACEHCLYLPAISTENTNHNLSRATIFGGAFDTGKLDGSSDEIDGFLSL